MEANLDVLGDLAVMALVVVRDDLPPGALLPSGAAAGARIRQATRGTAIVRADRRQAPAVVVAPTLTEGTDGLDVRGQVRAHEVVRVALKLGRHVRSEESHVGNVHRVDGGMEVDEACGAVRELYRDARAGSCWRNRGHRGHLGAGASHVHLRVREVFQSKKLRLQVAVHLICNHLHVVVYVLFPACDAGVVSRRLRDPLVAVGGRVEGGRPLKSVARVGLRARLIEVFVPNFGHAGVRAVDHWALFEVRVILAHDAAPVALALPRVKELLLVAREGVVGAVIVVRLNRIERLRADLDLVGILVKPADR